VLAEGDDSGTSAGQSGSSSFLDSFIEYTFDAPGVYVIQVGSCCIGSVPAGATYALQVSVEDHASRQDLDVYEVTLNSGELLEVETFTPAGGSGEFENEFDPMIRLYDTDGRLVAVDDNSAPDGRNANLSYLVPIATEGTYFIEVSASNATERLTRGEYILDVHSTPPDAVQMMFAEDLADDDDGSVAAAASALLVGDANLDGVFDSTDLVQVLQRGEYEDGVLDNSTYEEGDWNGDGDFDSADLVLVLQANHYASGGTNHAELADELLTDPDLPNLVHTGITDKLLESLAKDLLGVSGSDLHR
jgi:hypothetical protein